MNKETQPKKHPCQDCRFCQWCSDDRCNLCLKRTCCRRQLSMQEQIELYERLNSTLASENSGRSE